MCVVVVSFQTGQSNTIGARWSVIQEALDLLNPLKPKKSRAKLWVKINTTFLNTCPKRHHILNDPALFNRWAGHLASCRFGTIIWTNMIQLVSQVIIRIWCFGLGLNSINHYLPLYKYIWLVTRLHMQHTQLLLVHESECMPVMQVVWVEVVFV